MAVKKLLDENSLVAIKTYIDTTSGKVDDVKINNASILSSKIANISVDGTYNASSNKIASLSSITNAINALDVSNITGFGAGKTLATLTETNGKISATFQDIQLGSTAKVTGLDTALAGKVPTSRTIAGLALSSNISSSDLRNALDLTTALVYIGQATTTQPSTGHYVKTVIGGTTYYVSLDSDGTDQQVYAEKGQIFTIGTKEYICTTAGASGTNVFSEIGDEGSYALKTITVTGTGALSGGGTLEANRTITHNAGNAASQTSGFYKFSTDAYSHINSVTAVAKSDLTGLGVADDSAVVHKTGNENISGEKTFLNAVQIGGRVYGTDYFGALKLFNTMATTEAKSSGSAHQSIYCSMGNNIGFGLTNRDGNPVGSFDFNCDGLEFIQDLTHQFSISCDGKIVIVKYTSSGDSIDSYIDLPLGKGTDASHDTIACLSDIPSLSGYVTGSSLTSNNVIVGNGGSSVKDSGTAISTITSHISDSNIHVTSANKTAWNNKISNVRVLEVTSSTTGAGYQKLQQTSDGSNYTDIVACLSYNEAWAILTA